MAPDKLLTKRPTSNVRPGLLGRPPLFSCEAVMKTFNSAGTSRDQADMFAPGPARSTAVKCVEAGAEWISAIRNLVCPECGGRMGGRSKEFQCQGQCGTDWRPLWESAFARSTRLRTAKLSEHARRAVCDNNTLVARHTDEGNKPLGEVQFAI